MCSQCLQPSQTFFLTHTVQLRHIFKGHSLLALALVCQSQQRPHFSSHYRLAPGLHACCAPRTVEHPLAHWLLGNAHWLLESPEHPLQLITFCSRGPAATALGGPCAHWGCCCPCLDLSPVHTETCTQDLASPVCYKDSGHLV